MPSRTAAEVARAIGGEVRGNGALPLEGIAPLDRAGPRDLSFLANPRYVDAARVSAAGCVIVGDADVFAAERTVILAKDPYRAFALSVRLFHPETRRAAGVHPSAVVDPRAEVDATATVGPLAVVGRARLGPSCAVLATAVIGDGCEIGEDAVVHPGAVLYGGTVLGARVVVHARVVIGADGFGYASGPDGHVKIPHVGVVVVEDDVEIGAGTCIDRAALGETRIGRGTKIDDLVMVGHNVQVGEHSLLVAQSGVSGSTKLGRFVVLAGQSGVAGHLSVGDGARVAAKSAVLQDVEPGATVGGIPALPLATWKRAVAAFGRLPDLLRRVRRLEQGIRREDGDDTGAGDRRDGDDDER